MLAIFVVHFQLVWVCVCVSVLLLFLFFFFFQFVLLLIQFVWCWTVLVASLVFAFALQVHWSCNIRMQCASVLNKRNEYSERMTQNAHKKLIKIVILIAVTRFSLAFSFNFFFLITRALFKKSVSSFHRRSYLHLHNYCHSSISLYKKKKKIKTIKLLAF